MEPIRPTLATTDHCLAVLMLLTRTHSDVIEILQSRWKLLLIPCILVYLLLVRVLRFQRAKSLEKRYAPCGRESFRRMTADDAQAILKTLAELEFPSLYGFSMVVALFRVINAHTCLLSA